MICISKLLRVALVSIFMVLLSAGSSFSAIVAMVDELVEITVTVYADESETPAANSWYVLVDAEGMELYEPGTLQFIKIGDTLTTDGEGKSSLLLTSRLGTDSAYVTVRSPGGRESRFGPLTFWKPRLRFLDSNGLEVTPQDIDAYTGTWKKLRVEAVDPDNNRCETCNDVLVIKSDDSALIFSSSKGGEPITQVPIKNGLGSFWITSAREIEATRFSLEGMYDGNFNPRMQVDYDADIRFTDPPVPLLLRAEIFDRNGDGIADSLLLFFRESLEGMVPDSVFLDWPEIGKELLLAGGEIRADGSLLFRGDFGESPAGGASGSLRAVQSTETNLSVSQSTVVQDRVGPRILEALLLPVAGGPDSIFIRFSENIGSDFSRGGALLGNAEVWDVSRGHDWKGWIAFAVDNGVAVAGDSISLIFDGGLADEAGNTPSVENPKVVLGVLEPLPTFVTARSGFHDRNGDGRMDSVSLGFASPVNLSMLERLSLLFRWPDSEGKVLTHVPATSILELSENGMDLGFTIPTTLDIESGRTALDFEGGKEMSFRYTWSFGENERLEQGTIAMRDFMVPVIVDAALGTAQGNIMNPDTLRLVFSESLDIDYLDDPSLFEYAVRGERITPLHEGVVWNSMGFKLEILVARGLEMRARPSPGDSIRPGMISAALRDKYGNVPPEKTPMLLLMGTPRLIVQWVSFQRLGNDELDGLPFEVKLLDSETRVEELAESGKMGYLLDMAMVPVFRDAAMMDSLGYTLGDIRLKYRVGYYTNLGASVLQREGFVACDDEGFEGNCFENRRAIFLEWNYRSSDGRLVGTGAYVVRLEVVVETPESTFRLEKTNTWGILRDDEFSATADFGGR